MNPSTRLKALIDSQATRTLEPGTGIGYLWFIRLKRTWSDEEP
uniref:Uncharacterized protein n=1 Tax=Candidatus Kentrum sp. TUN TaxID=2126343 RepID=A0A451AJB0_9GAMM|nr:MAG: hypothetical protein BECKTUN1418D_GA0071000_14322 [Candidatus Kentron sp. TUN]